MLKNMIILPQGGGRGFTPYYILTIFYCKNKKYKYYIAIKYL